MVASPLVRGEDGGEVGLGTGTGEEGGVTPQICLSWFRAIKDHGAKPRGRHGCLHVRNMEKQTSQLLLPFTPELGY